MKKIFFCIAIIFSGFNGFSQQDSSHVRISLLTCGPGSDLYSTWGHSAIRVTDTTTHSDRVYNYGTFYFYDPDFYLNFIKGKLLYFLGVERYSDFVYGYQLEQRSIEEQVLNLSGEEKLRLLHALNENAKDENKFYRYDFLFDNCATRVRDIIRANTDSGLTVGKIIPDEKISFRQMIYYDLNLNQQHWSKLGIDILLGSGLDETVQNEQSMFLPVYLYKGFDSAHNGNKTLVANKNTIYTSTRQVPGASLFTPFVAFTLLLGVWILPGTSRWKLGARLIRVFDFLLFFSTGLLGLLLVIMWTGTDHQLCRNNFNLIWAIPFHAIAAFSIVSKRKWVKKYWLIATVVYALLLGVWVFLPQHLNTGLLPLVVLLGWRSWVQNKKANS